MCIFLPYIRYHIMTPMRQRVLLFLLLFPAFLFSQQSYRLGKAPFFKTFRAKKLAAALTNDLPDDSLKARSIYLWTTRHIRYDVKAFSKGRPSYMLPRKILLHRKAVCIGYSILYDSLCKYAGLSSEVVQGYAYESWYEARDTFFLDNHAWNVQLVNSKWELVDATWAAGYIKPRRQLTRRILYALFKIPYRQKYRYVRHRNDFYYETPPERLIETHLPSTPAWQLLPCSVPVDSFQYSPTAVMHFLRDSVKINCANGNDSIGKIMAETGNRHLLEIGKQAVYFNPRNHQPLFWGYWVYGENLYRQAGLKNLSRSSQILLLDSAAKQFDSTALYSLKAATDAKGEEHFMLSRNKRMRQVVFAENKPLIKKQKVYAKQVSRERASAKAAVKKLKRENRYLRKRSRKFQRGRFRTKRPDKPSKSEPQLIGALRDSIARNNQLLAITADSLQSLRIAVSAGNLRRYDTCIVNWKKLLKQQLRFQSVAGGMRKLYLINSYDTVMMETKERIFLYESKADSIHASVPPLKEWPANYNNRAYAANVKQAGKLMAANAKLCRKLARLSESDFAEDSAFYAEKQRYRDWNDSLIRENRLLINVYRAHAKSLRKLKKLHQRSAKRYRKELQKEDFRFVVTNEFFRSYFGGIAHVMKHNASNAKKMKSIALRRKRKLEKEEKKK